MNGSIINIMPVNLTWLLSSQGRWEAALAPHAYSHTPTRPTCSRQGIQPEDLDFYAKPYPPQPLGIESGKSNC